MARMLDVDLPRHKRGEVGLTYIMRRHKHGPESVDEPIDRKAKV